MSDFLNDREAAVALTLKRCAHAAASPAGCRDADVLHEAYALVRVLRMRLNIAEIDIARLQRIENAARSLIDEHDEHTYQALIRAIMDTTPKPPAP